MYFKTLLTALFFISSPAMGMNLLVQRGGLRSSNKMFMKFSTKFLQRKKHTNFEGFRIEAIIKRERPLKIAEQYKNEKIRLLNQKKSVQRRLKITGMLSGAMWASVSWFEFMDSLVQQAPPPTAEWMTTVGILGTAVGILGTALSVCAHVAYTGVVDETLIDLKGKYKDKLKKCFPHSTVTSMAAAERGFKDKNQTKLELHKLLAEIAEEIDNKK